MEFTREGKLSREEREVGETVWRELIRKSKITCKSSQCIFHFLDTVQVHTDCKKYYLLPLNLRKASAGAEISSTSSGTSRKLVEKLDDLTASGISTKLDTKLWNMNVSSRGP